MKVITIIGTRPEIKLSMVMKRLDEFIEHIMFTQARTMILN